MTKICKVKIDWLFTSNSTYRCNILPVVLCSVILLREKRRCALRGVFGTSTWNTFIQKCLCSKLWQLRMARNTKTTHTFAWNALRWLQTLCDLWTGTKAHKNWNAWYIVHLSNDTTLSKKLQFIDVQPCYWTSVNGSLNNLDHWPCEKYPLQPMLKST